MAVSTATATTKRREASWSGALTFRMRLSHANDEGGVAGCTDEDPTWKWYDKFKSGSKSGYLLEI